MSSLYTVIQSQNILTFQSTNSEHRFHVSSPYICSDEANTYLFRKICVSSCKIKSCKLCEIALLQPIALVIRDMTSSARNLKVKIIHLLGATPLT